jgi:hypothetical protein
MRRLVLSGIVCGLLGCALFASSEHGGRSPLQTIELLHKALRDADDHCGYEPYSLYRSVEGWKVANFADTDNPLKGKGVAEVCPAH